MRPIRSITEALQILFEAADQAQISNMNPNDQTTHREIWKRIRAMEERIRSQDSTAPKAIKKQYLQMAIKHHPDKDGEK